MNLPDLEIRIQRLLDDELTVEEFKELETELLENPQAMDLYLSYSALQSGLQRHGNYRETAKQVTVPSVEELLAQQRRRIVRISFLSAAAVLTLLAAVLWLNSSPATTNTFATVRATAGTDYTLTHESGNDPSAGNVMVENSRITIRHGVVELDLPHDVRAVVEAPAEMVLRDDRTLELDHGRAYFKVSSEEGQGFTVATPHQQIVDLGTAFGIDCQNGKHEVELHVLEGRVRVDSLQGDKSEIIKAPRSVLLAGKEVERKLDVIPASFLKDLPEKIELLLDEKFETGLIANRDYVIQMDPTFIRDPAGNRFRGIDEKNAWKFPTASAPGTVMNHSFEQNMATGGSAVAHWPEVTATRTLFNTFNRDKNLTPAHGNRFLTIQGDKDQPRILAQDLGRMISAGTTYQLTVAVSATRNIPSASGFIRIFGSEAGYPSALAETIVTPLPGQRMRDHTVTFTATAANTNGQTLGIALGALNGQVIFDNVRLVPISSVTEPSKSTFEPDPTPTTGRDTTEPVITDLHPANNATAVSPGGNLTITFDEPVKLGTGRIILKGINHASDVVLVAGDPRISVDGRVLTINPPAKLNDGTTQMGRINGWDSNGWVGTFNPDGKGNGYVNDDLTDQSKAKGVIGAMRGQVMATLSTLVPDSSIRRTIGSIASDRHYSVSVAIGARDKNYPESSFPGYTIRLVSGDTTLAELSSNISPGPPNSVNAVSLSWDSSRLPEGIEPGDPLSIKIRPNPSNSPGFLDLDSIRVSSIGQSAEK